MRRPKRLALLAAFCLCLAAPRVALANAGTPLMWAAMLHLVFGNLALGLIEGFMIARLLRQRVGRCCALMVTANYVSAWVGGLWIGGLIADAWPPDIYSAGRWLCAMIGTDGKRNGIRAI